MKRYAYLTAMAYVGYNLKDQAAVTQKLIVANHYVTLSLVLAFIDHTRSGVHGVKFRRILYVYVYLSVRR